VADRRLGATLYNLVETLRLVAHACSPFIPAAAEAISRQIGLTPASNGDWTEVMQWGRYLAGTSVQAGSVLFPKFETPGE
jgi:methionyl-tRNA synthetase